MSWFVWSRRVALALCLLSMAGCASLIDADQARLCRSLAVPLNPAGSRIEIVRITPGNDAEVVRVVYRVTAPGQVARTRFVACRFAGGTLTRNRQDLVGVSTDTGQIGLASLVFLRRFYMAQADAEDPDPLSGAIHVPETTRPLAYAAQAIMGALPQAGIYGLVAAAYSLIYGLVGRIVFGFGELAALGGYGALLGVTLGLKLGAGPGAALVAAGGFALWAAAWHGAVSGRLAVAPLIRGPGLPVLIATTGLMLSLSEYQRLAQGSDLRWVPPVLNTPIPILRAPGFVTTVTPAALIVAAASLAVSIGVILLLRRSGFGRAWRAFSDDPATAALFGIDPRRIFLATFALAAGLAGFAGFAMTAYYGGVGYGYGLVLGLKALVAAVLGGIGSVGGGLLGGVLIALAEALWSATMPIESRDIATFALLAILLALRPGGILGWRDLTPRRV